MEGSMQSDQLTQFHEIFNRFDMDSDGSLTLLELAALLRSLGLKPEGDQLQLLLNAVDANGNGSIEFDELINGILMPNFEKEEMVVNQGQLIEVFRIFDKDGNGVISASELANEMVKMGQPLNYRQLSELIDEADADGDGVINFREFAMVMAQSATDFLGVDIMNVYST